MAGATVPTAYASQPRRPRSRRQRTTPASLKGSLTNLLLARLAIDRIVKETTDATGRCDPPVSGGHAGRFAQFAVFVLTSGESYDIPEIARVNTLAKKT